jgi:hypothetical protein
VPDTDTVNLAPFEVGSGSGSGPVRIVDGRRCARTPSSSRPGRRWRTVRPGYVVGLHLARGRPVGEVVHLVHMAAETGAIEGGRPQRRQRPQNPAPACVTPRAAPARAAEARAATAARCGTLSSLGQSRGCRTHPTATPPTPAPNSRQPMSASNSSPHLLIRSATQQPAASSPRPLAVSAPHHPRAARPVQLFPS